MKGFMYILKCSDGSYYVGSTKNLEVRIAQHQAGKGANHTKKRLPVELVYYEEYDRIDTAFYREKQWSEKEKTETCSFLGLNFAEIFPVKYKTKILCDGKFHRGSIIDFNVGKNVT